MKSCTGCGNDFPLERYAPKERWNDGTVRSRQSRCPICLAEQRYDQQARYRERKRNGCPVDAEATVRLPIAPWRDWIAEEFERLGRDPGADPQALLAARMGVDDRRLYSWRMSTQRISMDVVDRACCTMGEPQLLRELYPELWDFDGKELAA